MCEVKVYIFGACRCRTSRTLLCSAAEENNYEPCQTQTPADKDSLHSDTHCPYHQNLLEKQNQENEENEEEEEGKKKPHDNNVGIIRRCSKDETWYFSPKELGAGRITVDARGKERRFPEKSPEPVKKIRVRLALPPPPPPPPAL